MKHVQETRLSLQLQHLGVWRPEGQTNMSCVLSPCPRYTRKEIYGYILRDVEQDDIFSDKELI